MEMRPGYKQTAAGVIPEDWETNRLGELTEFITSGSRGWSAHYADDGALFIRSQNVRAGRLDFEDCQFVRPPRDAEANRTRVNRDDLLITITGNSVGNVALVDSEFAEAYISQHVGLVRLSEPQLGHYVCRFLSPGSSGNNQIWASQSGQSKPGLTLHDLRRFWVALPPTAVEQRAITAALNDVDALLEGLTRLIAKKRDLKQAAMQRLLTGHTRLRGFRGEWEVKTLEEIVSTPITDGPHLTPAFLADGVPFLSVNNLVNNQLDLQDLRFVSKEDHLEFSKKCQPRKGDILFGKAASVGMVALIETDLELNIWSPLALIRVGHKASARYVCYALQTDHVRRQIKLLTNSSSQGNIGMGEIGLLEIPLPTPDEQAAIAAVLFDMDVELSALDTRRDKTRALKKAMMQELLTGRTRLV